MHNPVAKDKVCEAQESLAKEQGGSTIEGKGGDPHSKHESPPAGSGHDSAKGGKKKAMKQY